MNYDLTHEEKEVILNGLSTMVAFTTILLQGRSIKPEEVQLGNMVQDFGVLNAFSPAVNSIVRKMEDEQ